MQISDHSLLTDKLLKLSSLFPSVFLFNIQNGYILLVDLKVCSDSSVIFFLLPHPSSDVFLKKYFSYRKNFSSKMSIWVFFTAFISFAESISYCCVTNYHKRCDLKEHTFPVLHTLPIRSWHRWLGWILHWASTEVPARALLLSAAGLVAGLVVFASLCLWGSGPVLLTHCQQEEGFCKTQKALTKNAKGGFPTATDLMSYPWKGITWKEKIQVQRGRRHPKHT